MAPTIVCVHGGGNYLPDRSASDAAATIATAWKARLAPALRRTVDDLDVQAAYYAHHTNRGDIRQGFPDNPDEMNDQEIDAVLDWLATMGVSSDVPQGRSLRHVRQALSWAAQHYGLDRGLVERFVARFFSELCTYFDMPDVRSEVQDTVADAIGRHASTIVVAHSLGCIVAYEALWRHRPAGVDLFLTLGAPLAIPHVVFDRLMPAPVNGRGARPPTVTRWINVADAGDLVAIPQPLSDHFTGITGDIHDAIALFDFHRAVRYLECPSVIGALSSHL